MVPYANTVVGLGQVIVGCIFLNFFYKNHLWNSDLCPALRVQSAGVSLFVKWRDQQTEVNSLVQPACSDITVEYYLTIN